MLHSRQKAAGLAAEVTASDDHALQLAAADARYRCCLTLPAKPPAGDMAHTSKSSLMSFRSSINTCAVLLKWHHVGERRRQAVFTWEFCLVWMYWAEMVKLFALPSD